jgi:hypothetical protein
MPSSCPTPGTVTLSYCIPAWFKSAASPSMISGRLGVKASLLPVSFSPSRICTLVWDLVNVACETLIPNMSFVSPHPVGQGSESIRVSVPGAPMAMARMRSGWRYQKR